MINEIWKNISGYEDLYQISNMGRVKSLQYGKERILKNSKYKNDYLYIRLCNNYNKKNKKIHRLVAESFIPNPEDKPEVNHIDGNKLNNNINNLEWVTHLENMQHAAKNGLIKIRKGINNSKSKCVYQYTLDNIFIKKWDSISIAAIKLRIYNISDCVNYKRNSAGGYVWSYIKKV